MADFTLPLRPAKHKSEKRDTLAIRIAQINAQRGSFRNVTEASLQAEIGALRAAGKDPNEAVDEQKDRDETLDRQEQLFKSRAEVLEFAMQAHAEATYALDFVSLLLSKHNPRQAEMAMSPYLKLKTPLGSLGVDVVQTPERPEAEQRDTDAVSRGWKLQSFTSAADNLLESAARLEETVATETQYWSEVLSIKEKGWKLCRLPREGQTLGVQYGFMEAAPTFRDRGLAALRKGEGGKLVLDQGVRSTDTKVVRVRVMQDDQIVGSSIPTSASATDSIPVEEHIRQARDSLFEEELFYELTREARSILKHGVHIRRNSIQFPAGTNSDILIDLVDVEDARTDPTPGDHDQFALALVQSFRTLLSHAHRKNLRRRSQIPPPVTSKKRPTPEYILLRPNFCYVQHRSHFQWLGSVIDSLTKTLRSAGFKCNPAYFPFTSRRTSTAPTPNVPPIESFVDSLLNPLESYITVPLCSPSSGFRIRLFTNLHPTGIGSQFDILTNLPALSHAMKSPLKFGLRDDVEQFIRHMCTIDLVHAIAAVSEQTYPSPSPSQRRQDPATENTADDGWEDDEDDDGSDSNTFTNIPGPQPFSFPPGLTARSDPALKDVHLLPWEPSCPGTGELTAFSPAKNRSRKLCVQLQNDELVLRANWVEGPNGSTAAIFGEGEGEGERLAAEEEERFVWRFDDAEGAGQGSLEEAIREMGKCGTQVKSEDT